MLPSLCTAWHEDIADALTVEHAQTVGLQPHTTAIAEYWADTERPGAIRHRDHAKSTGEAIRLDHETVGGAGVDLGEGRAQRGGGAAVVCLGKARLSLSRARRRDAGYTQADRAAVVTDVPPDQRWPGQRIAARADEE
jgi:hypothetical protein